MKPNIRPLRRILGTRGKEAVLKGYGSWFFGWCSIIKPVVHYLHSTSSSSNGQINRQDDVKNVLHFNY